MQEHIERSRALLGTRVRLLRRECELTQAQFSKMTGLDRSCISRVECGTSSASLDTLIIIANGFDLSPSDLLVNIGVPAAGENGFLPITIAVPTKMLFRYGSTGL